MTARHISRAAADRLLEGLSERDRAILGDLARVRVLSGHQLTRLHFHELAAGSKDRTRRRVLERLTGLTVVTTLERRIGGVHAGSAGLVYALGVAGQHLVPLLGTDSAAEPWRRPRSPWTPGQLFLAHTLTVAELYVQLVEATRREGFSLGTFLAEPASWVATGLGGWLKPDAYAVLRTDAVEDCWWIEVDRATESLATLRRKLLTYLDFVNGGQPGPDGVVPRVLITVPDDKRRRRSDVAALLEQLPGPASKLFQLAAEGEAVRHVVHVLRE